MLRYRYSSHHCFSLCSCLIDADKRPIKKPFILSLKDEERSIQLSWYHLHSLLSHDSNLVEYMHTPARSRGPPAEVYSHLTGDFFSQLPGFIHSPLTYGLSTSRPLSVRNRYLLLVPSTLFAMQLYKCLKIYNMDGFSLSRFLRKIQQIHHQNISLVQ